jgi:hypothetical protein
LSTDLSKVSTGEGEAEVFARRYQSLSLEKFIQSELAFHIRCQKIGLYQLVQAFAVKRKHERLQRVQRSTCKSIAIIIKSTVQLRESLKDVAETLFQNARAGLRYFNFMAQYGICELYNRPASFNDIL